jgi:hypothetical protein
MSKNQARMISFAIFTASGAICIAFNTSAGTSMGVCMLLVGGIGFFLSNLLQV